MGYQRRVPGEIKSKNNCTDNKNIKNENSYNNEDNESSYNKNIKISKDHKNIKNEKITYLEQCISKKNNNDLHKKNNNSDQSIKLERSTNNSNQKGNPLDTSSKGTVLKK